MKVIISGGGTGGHVFPAIAIADAIKKSSPETDILFVGANGKIEMEKVPKAGYKIKGLDVVGFHRKLTLRNLLFPFRLLKSMIGAYQIVKSYKPDVAIGVGGYASGPILKAASWLGVPVFVQEQNSFAGVTNKLLGSKAKKIFVAYEGMERFFEMDKIIFTGNPVREEIYKNDITLEKARADFHIDTGKKTILVFGGSLGARKLNEAIAAHYDLLKYHNEVQLIWQVGKLYYDEFKNSDVGKLPNVLVLPFIDNMASAYKAADLVVCRAGALTISELMLVGKAAILVPSPNVAEDHQTHNALALTKNNAALMVKDSEAAKSLVKDMLNLVQDESTMDKLRINIQSMAKENAADVIAKYILNYLKEGSKK